MTGDWIGDWRAYIRDLLTLAINYQLARPLSKRVLDDAFPHSLRGLIREAHVVKILRSHLMHTTVRFLLL